MTLFASAFPLAAAVSIVFLFIEGRADLFKLLYVYQRPRVRRYDILHTGTLFIYYYLFADQYYVMSGIVNFRTKF